MDEEGSEAKQKHKHKGHGRNGADAYRGAKKIRVPHASPQPSDVCPECRKGKVYEMKKPGVLIRIVGQAVISKNKPQHDVAEATCFLNESGLSRSVLAVR